MILSAHQPNFFPWLPYYKKIEQSNVFVFMGNVQFARGQYQNRFLYKDKWHTMSVNSGSLSDLIVEKQYVQPSTDWGRIKNSLSMEKLSEFDSDISTDLYQTNIKIINKILDRLEISTEIKFDQFAPKLDPNQRIISLCEMYGADTYLTGPSGAKYLNIDLFRQRSITIKEFSYPLEQQIPILSFL